MYLKELCWHKPSLFFWFGAFCDVLHDKAWIQTDCICNWKVRFSCLYTNMKQLLLEAHLSQCPCVTMVTQPRDLKDGAGRASVNRLALQFWTWKTAGETRAEAGCAEIPGRAAPFILGFLIWGFKYKLLLSEEPDSQNANTARRTAAQREPGSTETRGCRSFLTGLLLESPEPKVSLKWAAWASFPRLPFSKS